MLYALAILPIVLLFALMVGLRWPAIRAMPVAWLLAVLLGALYWQMPANILLASNAKAVLISIDIIIILFGAIFLLEALKQAGLMRKIGTLIKSATSDKRVAAIIIAWSFVAMIEGAAGFGTPAALAAPLLVSAGIAPQAAVMLALLGDSTSVSFGALGTPIEIGINEGIGGAGAMLFEISSKTALIHTMIGLFIPFIIVLMLTVYEKKTISSAIGLFPFAFFAGASFSVPFLIVHSLFGPQFPSLIGGMVSLALVFLAAKTGFLLGGEKRKIIPKEKIYVFAPYLLAAFLLIASKVPAVNRFLKSASFDFSSMFGTEISHLFAPLANPGAVFFISALIVIAFIGLSKKKIGLAASATFEKSKYTFVALCFAIGLVQVFLNSSQNGAGIESMPNVMAQFLASLAGSAYIFVAPIIGLLGAFLAGSNTVSNIFFGAFQEHAAIALALPVATVLALQVVGGAAGNMIAVHNVIAAGATVGLKGGEGEIIKFNLLPAIAYALVASLIAIALMMGG